MPRKTRMNDLTSRELVSQVNPENLRLKNDFLNYLKSLQRSPGTIRGYDNDLDIFFVYCMKNLENKKFTDVSKRDLVSFQNWLINENGNSPSRVRRIKSAISSLSNYIENILDDESEFKDFRSIIRKISSPALQQVREKTVWSDEELDELLNKLSESGQHKKACAVALAMYSGRRKAELGRFRVDDFKAENLVCGGALYKTSEKIRTKGLGLGKYIYCYTLAKEFKPYFDAWMAQRKELRIESEWLLPDAEHPDEPIKESTLNSWAITFSNMTGRPFYLHALRHKFVTNLVRSGIPDSVITQIVGWESADMCKVYTDIDPEEQIGMYFNGEKSEDNNLGL